MEAGQQDFICITGAFSHKAEQRNYNLEGYSQVICKKDGTLTPNGDIKQAFSHHKAKQTQLIIKLCQVI